MNAASLSADDLLRGNFVSLPELIATLPRNAMDKVVKAGLTKIYR